MAEKTLNARFQLKYDKLADWQKTDVTGQGANLVLKKGEIAFCEIPTNGGNVGQETPPAVMFKVGDGEKTFAQLPWGTGLAGDVYDWAGKYREINIQKCERILVGKSVWYSNWDTIDRDLNKIWKKINAVDWQSLNREDFAKKIAKLFSAIWQVHPFREGNTRTTVMMIALFVEHYGYYFDYELISSSAGYVRNAFVLSCLGEYSEFEHLEKILIDAISNEPIEDTDIDGLESKTKETKYKKYYTGDYKPTPHEYVKD